MRVCACSFKIQLAATRKPLPTVTNKPQRRDFILVAFTHTPNYDMSLSRVYRIHSLPPFPLSFTRLSDRMRTVMFFKGAKREDNVFESAC